MKLKCCLSLLLLVPVLSFAQKSSSPCTGLVLEAPEVITPPGDLIEFKIKGRANDLSRTFIYEWTVPGFEFRGQGTSRVEVQTNRRVGNTEVSASLKVTDQESGCSVLLSETASIGPVGPSPDHFWQEFDSGTKSSLRAELDLLFVELMNDPDRHGIVKISLPKSGSRKELISILNLIDKQISRRRVDRSRILYHLTIGEYKRIRALPVPPKADLDFFNIKPQDLINAEEYRVKGSKIINIKIR